MRKGILAAMVALMTAVGVPLALFAAPTTTADANSSISAPSITWTQQSPNAAGLSWTQVSGAGGYNVYKNGNYLTTTSNTSYSQKTSGTVDRWYVTAFDTTKQHFSGRSNEVTLDTRGSLTKKPATPTWSQGMREPTVYVNGQPSVQQAQIFWNSDSNADGYNVYRNGTYRATVHYNSYLDERYHIGDEYYVVAFNDAGFSGKSSTMKCTKALDCQTGREL